MSDLQVLPFSSENLAKGLENNVFSAAAVALHGSVKYLASYLQDLQTRTIVVESDYTDGDYLDDFAAYYVKCFQDYQRRCKRLHFFACDFDESRFRELVRGSLAAPEPETIRSSYLGFVVARPLPDAVIGRSVLKPYPSDGGRRNYPCTKEYKASLFGFDLSVRSLAFQEQDGVLAACATVALWSAFHKTADLFGTPIPTPVEITRVANQIYLSSRPVPSHGLNVQQICNSIRHVGLEPEVVQIEGNTPAISLIYGHLRMGLPVLLVVEIPSAGLHAITLAGYSLRDKEVHKTEVASPNLSLPLVGRRIDQFYGHDDNFGPFGRLHIRPEAKYNGKTYPVVLEGCWIDPKSKAPLPLYPVAIVVPVYHKIRITFLDALQWVTLLHRLLEALYVKAVPPVNIRWDLHLTKSNDYKTLIKSTGIAQDQLERLLLLHHPRFVWHASLFIDDRVALDLLIDATDMARSFPIYHAIWREKSFHSNLSPLLNSPAAQSVLAQWLGPRFLELLKSAPPP